MDTEFSKPGLPRIAPSSRREISDDNGHLWSVSYADLLMVLLSFFIIFFSVDSAKRNQVIEKILATQTFSKTGGGGTEQGTPRFNEIADIGNLASSLRSFRRDFGINVEKSGDSILLHFPDNIFNKNQTQLNTTYEEKLRNIVRDLLPYKDKVQLTFIGNADATPVIKKTKTFKNNFDLSALRANKAMMSAAEEGFPLSGLRLKASSSFERASRTLSIQINAKENSDE